MAKVHHRECQVNRVGHLHGGRNSTFRLLSHDEDMNCSIEAVYRALERVTI